MSCRPGRSISAACRNGSPARAARHGLTFDRDAAALLAERVEGNLLAAHQEIEKLALLHAGGRIGADEVQSAVANSARYDVYQLGEAALEGDVPRSIRILDGLRAEGAEPPLVLWAICRELRALADARTGTERPAYGRAGGTTRGPAEEGRPAHGRPAASNPCSPRPPASIARSRVLRKGSPGLR